MAEIDFLVNSGAVGAGIHRVRVTTTDGAVIEYQDVLIKAALDVAGAANGVAAGLAEPLVDVVAHGSSAGSSLAAGDTTSALAQEVAGQGGSTSSALGVATLGSEVDIVVNQGEFPFGANRLRVNAADGAQIEKQVTFDVNAGEQYVVVANPSTAENSLFSLLQTGTPANGQQIHWTDYPNTEVNPDGTYSQAAPTTFSFRVWDLDYTWSNWSEVDNSFAVDAAASVLTSSTSAGAAEVVQTVNIVDVQGATNCAAAAQAAGDVTKSVQAEAEAISQATGDTAVSAVALLAGSAAAALVASGSTSTTKSTSGQVPGTSVSVGNVVVETSEAVSGQSVAVSSAVAGALTDFAAVAAVTGQAAATGQAAVTRLVASTSVADSFSQGGIVVDRSATGHVAAVATAEGSFETGVVQNAQGQGVGASVTQALPAKLINLIAQVQAQLFIVPAARADRPASATAQSKVETTADADGGTPVFPGYLYAHDVAIIPTMSCYTKVTYSMMGQGDLTPAAFGECIVKPT